MATTRPALSTGTLRPYSPFIMAIPSVSVLNVGSWRMSRENGSSFHMDWKPMMAMVAIIGAASGVMTLTRIRT
jgi:hypothetical protein